MREAEGVPDTREIPERRSSKPPYLALPRDKLAGNQRALQSEVSSIVSKRVFDCSLLGPSDLGLLEVLAKKSSIAATPWAAAALRPSAIRSIFTSKFSSFSVFFFVRRKEDAARKPEKGKTEHISPAERVVFFQFYKIVSQSQDEEKRKTKCAWLEGSRRPGFIWS